MHTTLKFIALFSLLGLSGAAAAEFAGFTLPAYVSAETAIGLFVSALALLTFGNEYAPRAGYGSRATRRRLVPASAAFMRKPAPARRPARVSRTFKPTVKL